MDHCDRCFLCLDRHDTGQVPLSALVDLLYESGVVEPEVPREEVEETFAAGAGVEGGVLFRYQFYAWASMAFQEENEEDFERVMEEIIAACSTNHY